ncbi:hypothetical protein HUK80_10820 [Flavobacterium sp. MAH-1]|uniref:Uncharacterized protein n=1 Tax=Flavobacterium agri TaxID=2743471 RepID=A0A7Y9C5W6_9FLAO|nr:hypothetical protein [Flavobacterium agri]NUY81391.1 hypothetical protein [Flavobacterium agri]NYA71415.1 hypothetical protein [Flavobacterium agri]
MRKLTIPLLVTSFLLVFGCASKPKPNAKTEFETVTNPYFSNPETDYTYRTKITVYGHELNGILIAKKINDSIHRVVLTTDFGNTLIDFEVGQNSFKKNNVVDDLDRKIVVNTLRDDFRLLFREKFASSELEQSVSNGVTTFESTDGRNHYRLSYSANKLISISKGSRKKEQVSVGFHSENNIFADKIQIQHRDTKLKIEMSHFAP